MARTVLAALLTLFLVPTGAILTVVGFGCLLEAADVQTTAPVPTPGNGPQTQGTTGWLQQKLDELDERDAEQNKPRTALDDLNEVLAERDKSDTQGTTPARLQRQLETQENKPRTARDRLNELDAQRGAEVEGRMGALGELLDRTAQGDARATALDVVLDAHERARDLAERQRAKEREAHAHQLRIDGLQKVSAGLPMMGVGVLSAFWFRRRWKATSNRVRRIVVVWIGVLFLIPMCLYPPSTSSYHPYEFLWESAASIDLKRLFVQMMAVALPVGAVLFALRDRTNRL